MDRRRLVAEALLQEAMAGLADAHWRLRTQAFYTWCYRQDNGKSLGVDCSKCGHDHLDKIDLCGEPKIGGFPHFDVCLCGPHSAAMKGPLTTIGRDALKFTFGWIDEATDVLRRSAPLINGKPAKELRAKIKELITRKTGGTTALDFIGGKDV